ncbi:MAG: efflux RND transporter periplasmic adaptor subunit [Candidatus Muirbacterium halophilum]|nr:efflux RND transporter periplasmic adaptor subunit [Candidatus Muirbacterium halophilum]
MNIKKIGILLIVIIALSLVVFVGNKSNKTDIVEKKAKLAVVDVIDVKPTDITQVLDLTGSVEPYHNASLASPAEGPVAEIKVREGDMVKKDQDIIIIGRTHGIDALIASLEEEMRKEKSNLDRTELLYKNNVLPAEKYEIARASFEKVNAALIKAQEQSRDYIIKAPWDGIVEEILVKEGEYLSPRQKLVSIYEPQTLIIKSTVYEKYAMDIKENMEVNIVLDAYNNQKFNGFVKKVYPYLNNKLRTRPFEVDIENDIVLLPGMFARLSISLKEIKNTVVIPSAAVFTDKDGDFSIFTVEDNKAVQKKVYKGIENGADIEIIKGLVFGDKVIVNGIDGIKNNSPVKILNKQAKIGGDK